MEWQPMETAPRDGTPFFIFAADGRIGIAFAEPREYEGLAFFSSGSAVVGPDPHDNGRTNISMSGHYYETATHWLPLPEPPAKQLED